jgi:hypothetical protein
MGHKKPHKAPAKPQPKKLRRQSPDGYDAVEAHLNKIVRHRPKAEGISIDAPQTQLIDDGIWIEKNSATGGWTIKTYIADVPASVLPQSKPAQDAIVAFQGTGNNLKNASTSAVLQAFSRDHFDCFVSLHEGKTRPVMAFTMELSGDGTLQSYTITREAFTNLRKCDLTPLGDQLDALKDVAEDWYRLSYQMLETRLNMIADTCDKIAEPKTNRLDLKTTINTKPNHSELLVRELMRLTNSVAADYIRKHNLVVPERHQDSSLEVVRASADQSFDMACDSTCRAIIKRYREGVSPKVRLSSPMRIYGDYVTIKILADQLEGRQQSPALVRESKRLTREFHEAARKTAHFNPQPGWDKQRRQQSPEDPFDNLTSIAGDARSLALKNLACEKSWSAPDMAVRKLSVPGAYFFLVAIQQETPDALGKHRGYGIALSYEHARERAAHRVLASIRKMSGYVPPESGPKP